LSFDVSVDRVGGVLRCVVTGDVDVATAAELRETLLALIGAGERRIVLDVSAVPFLDSTGLGVLMEAHRALRPHSGELALVGAGPALVRLLTLTNLSRALPAYGSVADVVAAWTGGRSGEPAPEPAG
jgi:anti-anti-sigma factor